MFMTGVTPLRSIALRAMVLLCALSAAAPMAQAAELAIENVIVDYVTQTSSTASGTVTFDVTFSGLAGDAGNYDLAAVQVLISQTLKDVGGPVFSLSSLTNNTASIGSAYWLFTFGLPTGNQLSNTVGDEFYFGDFVSPALGRTPAPGELIARFVLGFEADELDEFGTYVIERGDASNNKFTADLFTTYPNTIAPASFNIQRLPEPSTVILLAAGFAALLPRRRRRRA